MLFNLFINYLCDSFSGPKDLYADDLGVILSNSDPSTLIQNAEETLHRINDWCIRNGMKINWSKSYFMFFFNKRMKQPPVITKIEVGSVSILRVSEFKYLGIWLDETLSFETHILKLIAKLNPRIHFLLRLKRLIPPKKFPQVFRAIVMSNLEYGIQIWGGASNILIKKLQNVITNCLKRWFSPRKIDVFDMYERFNLLMLNEYSDYYLLLFAKMFTPAYRETSIPNALKNFVKQSANDIHLRN
jgi:hypothetical protein